MNAVNHPAHYTQGGIEVIDAIEAWSLGFHLGNAVKYIARAGKKDPAKLLEDLEKARWYLQREIDKLVRKDREHAEAIQKLTFENPMFPTMDEQLEKVRLLAVKDL